MPPGDALVLSLDGSLPALEAARRQLLEHLGPAGGWSENRRAVYAAELVLEEWLTNVFRHGGCSRVELRAFTGDGQLTLQFADDGRPFDPTRQAAPPRPASLDDAEPGGLGLFLIQRYARACDYRREAGHNLLQVLIDFTTRPSASAPPA